MKILVTGATGTIGRHITAQLAAAGHQVRALSRNPATAKFPEGVDAVAGDLTRPATLDAVFDGITAMHLISLGGDDYAPLTTAPAVLARAAAAGVRRVTVLTGTVDELAVFAAVRESGLEWTHIRPEAEFMANKLGWAASVARDGVVRAAFGETRSALVHEVDVAAVIAAALTEDGHGGASYSPTGPEALSRSGSARVIGEVLGKRIQFVELTRAQARQDMIAAGIDADTADFVLDHESDPPAGAMTPVGVVQAVTATQPRTFAEWVAEHAADFGGKESTHV